MMPILITLSATAGAPESTPWPAVATVPAANLTTLRSSQDPAYIVHAPMGLTFWVVAAAPDWDTLHRFRTLTAALNFIRPVLAEPDAR